MSSPNASWHPIFQVSQLSQRSPMPLSDADLDEPVKEERTSAREQSISNIPLRSIEQEDDDEDIDEDGGGGGDDDNDINNNRDYDGQYDLDYVKSDSESDADIHRMNCDSESDVEPHHPKRKRSPSPELSEWYRRYPRRALNPRYVDLLNDDIEDVLRHYTADDWRPLHTTQVGLTVWREEEKELLYEAVSRLGKDDAKGIARRLPTKSEVEVRHYLHMVREKIDERRVRPRDPLLPLPLSEFPAAVAISSECCAVLDAEAEVVVRKEVRNEAKAEGRHWGPHWLVTGANCGLLSKAALALAGVAGDGEASDRSLSPMVSGSEAVGVDGLVAHTQTEMRPEAVPPLSLLHTPNMLLLSERVFMNGVAKDDNYLGLGTELPGVQMSALNDMHDIIVALTRRLVATAVHMSQSRDRAQHTDTFKRLNKNVVHVSDVHAAISSLGLKRDTQQFWARCPRRLNLRVSRSAGAFSDMHNPAPSHEVCDEDADIMTYNDAERELQLEPTPGAAEARPRAETAEGEHSGDDSDSRDDDDGDDDGDGSDAGDRIDLEFEEITTHSATGFPDLNWARQILRNRISDELREEAYADVIDRHKSSADELYMWKIVGKKPPESTGLLEFDESKPPEAENFISTRKRIPIDQIIDTGRNWSAKLRYEAEWEDAAAEVQQRVAEAKDHDVADE